MEGMYHSIEPCEEICSALSRLGREDLMYQAAIVPKDVMVDGVRKLLQYEPAHGPGSPRTYSMAHHRQTAMR